MNTLQTVITDFLRHCRFEKNLSDKTLKAYGIDLKQLMNFLIARNYVTDVIQISKVELREYLEYISTLKPRSIKRKIATIKALFNYLEFEDRVAINPFRKMRVKIRENKTVPSVMDMREISKIFGVAYKRKNKAWNRDSYSYFECIRDIIIVELLFATGARVSEIAELKKDNINLFTGNILIKGKGNKERIIQVCNQETITILKNYYELCNRSKKNGTGYFLVNRFGRKLSDQSIRNVVKKLSRRAGINRRITPHVFRHSFATLLLERDVDIKYIQSLLGHSSITTTQIYTHVNRLKQKKILSSKHPRKDFCMSAEMNEG